MVKLFSFNFIMLNIALDHRSIESSMYVPVHPSATQCPYIFTMVLRLHKHTIISFFVLFPTVGLEPQEIIVRTDCTTVLILRSFTDYFYSSRPTDKWLTDSRNWHSSE